MHCYAAQLNVVYVMYFAHSLTYDDKVDLDVAKLLMLAARKSVHSASSWRLAGDCLDLYLQCKCFAF